MKVYRNFILAFSLVNAINTFAQETGSFSFGFGGGRFNDHEMNAIGMRIAIQTPYLLKPEKLFLSLGKSYYFGEGGGYYDPNQLQSFVHADFNNFFDDPVFDTDVMVPLSLKTARSTHSSLELMVGKGFHFNAGKTRITASAGAFVVRIVRHYHIQFMNLELGPQSSPAFGPAEFMYSVPFGKEYTYYHLTGAAQIQQQLSKDVYIFTDAQYFHKKAPFTGNFFFTVGVGVVF